MPSKMQWNSWIPLLMIFLIILVSYSLFYFHPPSLIFLKTLHDKVYFFSIEHPVLTPLFFMGFYIIYAALSLPGIFILSLLSGYLFHQPFSTLYPVCAATIGATILFLLTRTAFGRLFYRYAGETLISLEKGFQDNAASYLLFLRLIPLFPFWLVNIAGAFFRVSMRTFIWTTFVGMIPSTFAYAQAGKGLMDVFNPAYQGSILNPHLILSLVALALLSLVPLMFKKLRSTS